MEAVRISSRQHPFIKRCREAADRRLDGTVLLDGEHLLAEALAADIPLQGVLTDERPRSVLSSVDARRVQRYIGGGTVLEAASPVRTPSGVVALASWAPARMADVLAARDALVVGMIDVQDPGNVGGIIRSAHALGATGVLALDSTADPSGWKVLRGAMGSTFKMRVGTGSTTELLSRAGASRIRLMAAVAHGGSPLDQARFTRPLVLLLGNEGHGLPPDVLRQATQQVHVPLIPGAESLNVGATAAILLWEARSCTSARSRLSHRP
jgi:TrmH family RNA methyltransferase